jgi:hypothetical protein
MIRRSRDNLNFCVMWIVVPLSYFSQLASSSESTCSWYFSYHFLLICCLYRGYKLSENHRSYNDLHWDFDSLVRHKPQRDYKLERGSWNFHFNPCANTLRVPSMCKDLHSDTVASPGYQTLSKGGEEACYLLGILTRSTFLRCGPRVSLAPRRKPRHARVWPHR